MNIMTLFYFFAILTAAFIFWKKVKEEHFDDYQLFDYFFSSLLISWILARLGFIVLNFENFSFNFISWVDIYSKPGLSFFLLILFWGLILYRFAKKNTNNSFAVLDFWVTALAGASVWIYLGWLFSGSHFGLQTNLPIGMSFAGVFDKYHPTQAYSAIFYLLLYLYLSKLEYVYRTFSWYKGGKGSAQPGFLLGVFIIASGLWWSLMSFFKPAEILIGQTPLDIFLGLVAAMVGVIILISRSGKFIKSANSTAHDNQLKKPVL